jgi:hypothetical protein
MGQQTLRHGRSGVIPELQARLDADGHVLIPDILTPEACDDLARAVGRRSLPVRARRGGVRNLFALVPEASALARWPTIRSFIDPILGHRAFAVRALLFDKVEEANWRVPWHRDRVVAVRKRIDVPGFGGWSVKEGVHHAEPPREYLERMLSVRLHLDAADADNGPLNVIPGSHRDLDLGDRPCEGSPAVSIIAGRGAVLLMRPLIMHASQPSKRPAHRRVIHMEFASFDLPGGLEWNERW